MTHRNLDLRIGCIKPLAREISVLAFFLLASVIMHRDALRGFLLAVEDGLTFSYPMFLITRGIVHGGELPLWNPYTFSGVPLLGSIELNALYPVTFLQMFLPSPEAAFNIGIILHCALAGYFTSLFVRRIGAGLLPSIAAGFLFGFSGFLRNNLNHLSMLATAPWFPLMLYAVEGLRRAPGRRDVGLLGVAVGLLILAGSPQLGAYSLAVVALYALVMGPAARNSWRRFVPSLMGGAALGLLIASPLLIEAGRLTLLSVRKAISFAEFSAYSFSPLLLTEMLYPGLYTDASGAYFGPRSVVGFPEGAMGVFAPLLAAAFVLARFRRDRQAAFWGFVALAATALTLDTPLQEAMYHVPGYNLFRVASRNWFTADFALAVLVAMGLTHVDNARDEARPVARIYLVLAALAIAFIPLWALLLRGPLFEGLVSRLFVDPSFIAKQGWLVFSPKRFSVPMVFLALYALWATIATRSFSRRKAAMLLVYPLIAAEVFVWRPASPVGVPVAEVRFALSSTQLLNFLAERREDRTAFFVDATLVGQTAGTWLPPLFPAVRGIPMADGYQQLLPERYHDLLDVHTGGRLPSWRGLIETNDALSALDIRYILVNEADAEKKSALGALYPLYRNIFTDNGYRVYENTRAPGRAYMVSRLVPVASHDEAVKRIRVGGMDISEEALALAGDIQAMGRSEFTKGDASIVEYRAGSVTVRTRGAGPGLLVLADQYYPGWVAAIDGAPAPIYAVNAVQRGVAVPAGEHTVVMAYRPRAFCAALVASALAGLGAIFLLAAKRRGGVG